MNNKILEKSVKKPNPIKVSFAVAKVTFWEIIQDKLLYSSVLLAILLLAAGFLASRMTFVRPERVICDFGFSAINLCSSFVAILIGAGMIGREFDRRTILVALARPITRLQFLTGKFFGLVAVLLVNWCLLCSVLFCILLLSGGLDAERLYGPFFPGLGLILIQSAVMAAIAICISTFSTTSLSVIVCIGIYLIGNNISQIRLISARIHDNTGRSVISFISYILPDLEYFNLGSKITYNLPTTWQFVLSGTTYGLVLMLLFLLLAGYFVRNKEV